MNRPWFPFFAGDWRANVKLRRCSHAERGIWIEVMCLLHASDEYGVLRWPLKEIARVIGCKLSELRAIREKGVLKGADLGEQCEPYIYVPRHARKSGEPVTLIAAQPGPIFFSSRMVRDEYVRQARSGELPNTPPNKAPNPLNGASSGDRLGVHSEVRSQKEPTTAGKTPAKKRDHEYSAGFLQAWSEYPKRAGSNPKPRAWKTWKACVNEGHTEAELLAGVRRYAVFVRATGKENSEYVKQAATFFGPDKAFLEAWTLPIVSAASTTRPIQ
jgi:hypothetical protein